MKRSSVTKAVVCLDIDGTITTADDAVLTKMMSSINDTDTAVYINTARPRQYCDFWYEETEMFAPKTNHKCFNGELNVFDVTSSVAQSKLSNMNETYDEVKQVNSTLERSCVILIDDLDTNIDIVKSNGYDGIKVDPYHGITNDTLQVLQQKIENCHKNK